jgi:hypothetical protein
MRNPLFCILLSLGAAASVPTETPGEKIYQRGYLTKEEAHKSIQLPEGYRLELILKRARDP